MSTSTVYKFRVYELGWEGTHIYTGIGARNTPEDILELMQQAAYCLAKDGYYLRTGDAEGADKAFREGAAKHAAEFHLHLWQTCQVYSASDMTYVNPEVFARCEADFLELHPAPQRCSAYAARLLMRNGLQLLGAKPDIRPSQFILCWTPNAEITGGTGQSLRLAAKYGIKVFNLANDDIRARLEHYVSNHS